MTLQVTVYPGKSRTRILATYHGDDILKADFPTYPLHHHALSTLLEGVALWFSVAVHAVVVVDERSDPGCVAGLWGDLLWPRERSNITFDVVEPKRNRKIDGPSDFGDVHAVHGCTR